MMFNADDAHDLMNKARGLEEWREKLEDAVKTAASLGYDYARVLKVPGDIYDALKTELEAAGYEVETNYDDGDGSSGFKIKW